MIEVKGMTFKQCIVIIIILAIILSLIWATYFKKHPLSDHSDGTHFFNLNHQKSDKSLWDVIKWKLYTTATSWPEYVHDNQIPDATRLKTNELRATMINHATVLLQWGDLNIITDPILTARIGPQFLAWIKRHRDPGISFATLPRIDYILVSHNHYDHLDYPTIEKIIARDHSQIIVPLGVTHYLPKNGQGSAHELDWWKEYKSPDGSLAITLVPAMHWSKRALFDTNRSLWGGFVIEHHGSVVYFAGDTSYAEHFKLIAAKFPKIDLALLPIGSYEPQFFMKCAHMNPDDAVRAALDLRAPKAMGIHFGTFKLSDEGIAAPIKDLQQALTKHKMPGEFITPKNGTSISITPN